MIDVIRTVTSDVFAALDEELRVRQTREFFLLFPMGSQFDHLILQALARFGVFCAVGDPAALKADDVERLAPKGIILTGGPASVHAEPPPFDKAIFNLGIPVLGICLGFQMWAQHVGASVGAGRVCEYGVHTMTVRERGRLLKGFDETAKVLQSHGDRIEEGGALKVLAVTKNAVAAGCSGHLYGVQFHPEVNETESGDCIFENFCFDICGAADTYPAQDIAAKKIAALREQIGERRVLLALSGGSDSSVVAYLLAKAIDGTTGRVRAVYIKGIDRPDDETYVRKYFSNESWLELVVVDATDAFLKVLSGKMSMREKRLFMKGVYKEILEAQARDFGASFIAQGTLYTDISESGGGLASGARKAVIKEHHNTNIGFSIDELMPLADCVKDGARNIGRSIGIPEDLLTRHPFPGPGLVIRIEGEVTGEKLAMAREIDDIFIAELRKEGLYREVWQAGAVVTASRHTHTKGDDAGSGALVVLWAVTSVTGFTAQAAMLPMDFIERVSQRITNEVKGVAAVAYRFSGKPPATIEWG